MQAAAPKKSSAEVFFVSASNFTKVHVLSTEVVSVIRYQKKKSRGRYFRTVRVFNDYIIANGLLYVNNFSVPIYEFNLANFSNVMQLCC